MAGGDHHGGPIRFDPAVEKYYAMTSNRWRYFRWTPRTAFIAFMWAGLVPGSLAYLLYKTEGKYDMRAKLRGDPIREF